MENFNNENLDTPSIFQQCSLSLERLVKHYVLSSELSNIFCSQFCSNISEFRVETIVYLKIDNTYFKHKVSFYITLTCSPMLKPIFIFFDTEKKILAFKYQYKKAIPILCISEKVMKTISFDYAINVDKNMTNTDGSWPMVLNPSKFVHLSYS